MYKFVALDERAKDLPKTLKTEVNGINLDDKYQGKVKTLNVSGRGLIAPVNDLQQKIGTDGAWLEESFYPPRPIQVELLIQSRDLRTLYARLNYDLSSHNKELLTLRFTDDYNYLWYGKLNFISDIKENSYDQVIEIEFICPDPFKYEFKTRTAISGLINPNLMYLTRPEHIEFIVNETTNLIKITNVSNGQNIVVKDSFAKGDTVVLDLKQNTITKKPRTNLIKNLDIFSDFEIFSFTGGHLIEVSPSSSEIEITYRERSL